MIIADASPDMCMAALVQIDWFVRRCSCDYLVLLCRDVCLRLCLFRIQYMQMCLSAGKAIVCQCDIDSAQYDMCLLVRKSYCMCERI